MIKHIVLLTLSEGISLKQINLILQKLVALKQELRIHSFASGNYSSPEGLNRGYNFAFIMEFLNSSDRDHYLSHPKHIEIAQNEILPLLADGINSALAFDFQATL